MLAAMTPTDDLLAEIFDGSRGPLYGEFAAWLRASRRFQAFATEYRTKIRAKLKNARDAEGLKDARAELEAAALLLREKSFALEYEKYATSGGRGPDFTVTFKTHTPVNIEVRRVRAADFDAADPARQAARLVAVLCDKVGQMPPGTLNLLWLTAERDLSEAQLAAVGLTLRQLAEGKADPFFAARGFNDAVDFLRQYQWLAGVVLRQREAEVWLNPLARHKVPPEIIRALRHAASGAAENDRA